jgi:hypothetical protein
MYLDEHIERYEKAIRKFYMKEYGAAKGWTELQNIKSMMGYTLNNVNDWDTNYFKELQKYADDHHISVPKPKRELVKA